MLTVNNSSQQLQNQACDSTTSIILEPSDLPVEENVVFRVDESFFTKPNEDSGIKYSPELFQDNPECNCNINCQDTNDILEESLAETNLTINPDHFEPL